MDVGLAHDARKVETMLALRKLLRTGLAALACAGLAGCGSAPLQTFELSAPKTLATRIPRGQMAIAEPIATLPVDSDRIVIRTGPEAVAYLTGAQWPDRLPRLLQTRLIETFENAHLLRNVGRPGLTTDFSLTTEIRRFEIDVTSGMAVAEFSVKLVGDRSGRVVAAKVFSASAPSPTSGPPAMTAALDLVLGDVLRQIVAWAAKQA